MYIIIKVLQRRKTKMEKEVRFNELPRDMQLKIISDVNYYGIGIVHLHHANGKTEVETCVCIYGGKHPEDEWYSQNFNKTDFAFDSELKASLVDSWDDLCKRYDSMKPFKNGDIAMADLMVDTRNKIYEAQCNAYLEIVLRRTLERTLEK